MDTPQPTTTTPPTPPPVPPPVPPRRPHISVWRWFIGLMVILLGISLLSQQFGWAWFVPADVWKLWPIFIIIAGLSIMTRGRVVSTLFSILLVLAVVAFAAAAIFGGQRQREVTTRDFTVTPAATATEASVQLDIGAAKVRMTGGSAQLISGTYTSNVDTLDTTDTLTGTTQAVELSMTKATGMWLWGMNRNELTAKLTDTLPLTIDVNSGATDMDLDLTTVKAKRVTVDTGASALKLRLGATVPASTVKINAGASSIDVYLPRTLGAALNLEAAVSGKTLTDFVEKSANHYASSNYETAVNKVDITIQAGASSITFHWYDV
ncbi:MAG: hypothetical protein HY975_01005 [Candidatus Kerfeldbacteria bacterium]|nr:hypothetical protein [Candidatus Kerfeldbacteria bacterium]